MRYCYYSESELKEYPVVILVPRINKKTIEDIYITPFNLDKNSIIVLEIYQSTEKKKTPKKEIVNYIKNELTPILNTLNAKYLLVADGDYFKALTDVTIVQKNAGYVLPTKFGSWNTIYLPNFGAVFYDPQKVKPLIEQAINAYLSHKSSTYVDPGKQIIINGHYPKTYNEIKDWLDKLIEMNVPLSIDIEAFSLKHYDAGIGSICFCWSQYDGVVFPVDYVEVTTRKEDSIYGDYKPNEPIRKLLKEFFLNFNNKTIYHSITFDVYVMIYVLFMDHLIDVENMLKALPVMLINFDDTKLITYLATNSCSGNDLSLKTQAQEFAGNYAQEEINDIRKIPLSELLTYNLIDGLSTWYVYNKHIQTMIDDNQLDIYENLFKKAVIDIIHMQLTGMPLNIKRTKEVAAILQNNRDTAMNSILANSLIPEFNDHLAEQWAIKKNSEYKVKRVTVSDFPDKNKFNPNSDTQLRILLFDILKLPVLEKTKTKQASVKKEILKDLVNHTQDPLILDLLKHLVDLKDVEIILTTFIPPMLNAPMGPDGWHYLFGNFNLGGTVSGRLSSSKINLQNLPSSGTKYGKLIKSCFQAPPGWLFVGLDFASLEDRISALTTKDPNKLKVYTDGYDGHCLRAYSYFSDQMPDIDPNSVDSINSIQNVHKQLRQDSKVPTFLLTYDGTWIGIMRKCGFSEEKAKSIEANYHSLYSVSDDWKRQKIDQATTDGYVTVAFGLRVRTPILEQVVRHTSKTPYEAEQEARTAGNALGQSWCLLNTRAGIEFLGGLRTSQFKLDIKPTGQIHDAQYFLVRDDIYALEYINHHLVEAVKWQEDPEIYHKQVKLGGDLSIFYPTWDKELVIPNGLKAEEIRNHVLNQLITKEQ